MSLLCKKCGITFENREAKRWHYIDGFKNASYGVDLQEHREGHFLECMKDGALGQYFEKDESRVYHLRKGAKERIVENRRFISLDELNNILAPFDILATDVIRGLQDRDILGNRLKPSGIDKQEALAAAKALWLDN